MFYSVILALSQITDPRTNALRFVGIDNFIYAMRGDIYFPQKLLDSLTSTIINTPLVIIFSFFIAVLLNRKLKCKSFYRVAFLLPVVIGTGFVYSVLTGNNANVSVGVAGAAGSSATAAASAADSVGSFRDLELTQHLQNLLGPDISQLITGILMRVSEALWTSGIQIIIFLGALQTVPKQLYEAAYCDGATEWEKFWKITLPICSPTILLVIVYTMIDYFTSLTNSVMKYIMQTTFADQRYAYGSAMGWSYFACAGLLLVIIFVSMRKVNAGE